MCVKKNIFIIKANKIECAAKTFKADHLLHDSRQVLEPIPISNRSGSFIHPTTTPNIHTHSILCPQIPVAK